MVDDVVKKYFWDTDATALDISIHKRYIIERILDMGDEQAVSWLRQTFSKYDILDVLNKSKRLSEKSRNFWKLVAQSL